MEIAQKRASAKVQEEKLPFRQAQAGLSHQGAEAQAGEAGGRQALLSLSLGGCSSSSCRRQEGGLPLRSKAAQVKAQSSKLGSPRLSSKLLSSKLFV